MDTTYRRKPTCMYVSRRLPLIRRPLTIQSNNDDTRSLFKGKEFVNTSFYLIKPPKCFDSLVPRGSCPTYAADKMSPTILPMQSQPLSWCRRRFSAFFPPLSSCSLRSLWAFLALPRRVSSGCYGVTAASIGPVALRARPEAST